MRFLSDLVNCHVIAAPSMVAMFENFISVTQEEDVPQVGRNNAILFATLEENYHKTCYAKTLSGVTVIYNDQRLKICQAGSLNFRALGPKRT